MLSLEPELPGGFGQQVLVRGQVFAVPAQLEGVRGEIGGHVAQRKLRILSDQAGESVVPVEGQHFLVMVLQGLHNLRKERTKSSGAFQAGGLSRALAGTAR